MASSQNLSGLRWRGTRIRLSSTAVEPNDYLPSAAPTPAAAYGRAAAL